MTTVINIPQLHIQSPQIASAKFSHVCCDVIWIVIEVILMIDCHPLAAYKLTRLVFLNEYCKVVTNLKMLETDN